MLFVCNMNMLQGYLHNCCFFVRINVLALAFSKSVCYRNMMRITMVYRCIQTHLYKVSRKEIMSHKVELERETP